MPHYGAVEGDTCAGTHTHGSFPPPGLVPLPEMPSQILVVLKPYLALKVVVGLLHFCPQAPSCSQASPCSESCSKNPPFLILRPGVPGGSDCPQLQGQAGDLGLSHQHISPPLTMTRGWGSGAGKGADGMNRSSSQVSAGEIGNETSAISLLLHLNPRGLRSGLQQPFVSM